MNTSMEKLTKVICDYKANNKMTKNDNELYNYIINNKSEFTTKFLEYLTANNTIKVIRPGIMKYNFVIPYLSPNTIEQYDEIHKTTLMFDIYKDKYGFNYYYNKPSFNKYINSLTLNQVFSLPINQFDIYIKNCNNFSKIEFTNRINNNHGMDKFKSLLSHGLIDKDIYKVKKYLSNDYYDLLVKYYICEEKDIQNYRQKKYNEEDFQSISSAHKGIDKQIEIYNKAKRTLKQIENGDTDNLSLTAREWEYLNKGYFVDLMFCLVGIN